MYPRRWLSWAKRKGGVVGKSATYSTLKRDGERTVRLVVKYMTLCFQEKLLT